MAATYRLVEFITMKQKHINLSRTDKYGHWWFEIDDASLPTSESYGWWPERRVDLTGTFAGVAGELNGQTDFRGTPTRDPHHGDDADEEFHPVVLASDPRTDAEI